MLLLLTLAGNEFPLLFSNNGCRYNRRAEHAGRELSERPAAPPPSRRRLPIVATHPPLHHHCCWLCCCSINLFASWLQNCGSNSSIVLLFFFCIFIDIIGSFLFVKTRRIFSKYLEFLIDYDSYSKRQWEISFMIKLSFKGCNQ